MKQQIDYKQYLASREWRLKRKEVIELNNGICERCGTRAIEDIHHLTYASIGNESPLRDLMGVCHPCHEYLAAERDDDPALKVIKEIIDQHGLFPLEDWPSQNSWPWPLFISGKSKNGLTLYMRLIAEEDADNYETGRPKCLMAPGVVAAFFWQED